MVSKFDRNYSLSVGTQEGDTLLIEPPFTLEFDITRNQQTSANVCEVRLFNLSKKNRNLLRFDTYVSQGTAIPIILKAGYGENISTIFNGTVTQGFSVREHENYVTTLSCYDGGFAYQNAKVPPLSFAKGTPQVVVLKTLLDYIPGVTPGAISKSFIFQKDSNGELTGNFITLPRGNSYEGNTIDVINKITGGALFIDLGVANILDDGGVIEGDIILINSQTGLLGTPLVENRIISFEMLFEPRIKVGQLINIQSSTIDNPNNYPAINNQISQTKSGIEAVSAYKVISVKHRGMISPAVCGDAITTVQVFFQNQLELQGPA